MELQWEELSALRLIYKGVGQAVVEGILPPAEGRRAKEVLDYNAQIHIDSCSVGEGRTDVEGSVSVAITAADDSAAIFAFASTAAFTHSIPTEGAEPGMAAVVMPKLQTVSLKQTGDGQLMLSAIADLDCRVTCASPLRVLKSVSGLDDLEMKRIQLKHNRRIALGSETLRLREEISSDGADEVLNASGQIFIRDTSTDDDNAIVNGVLSISALCSSAEGELMQLVRHIPFRESIQLNGAAEQIYAQAELKQLQIRALGTEFSIISVEAEAEFKLFGNQIYDLSIPIDAFSPKLSFECVRDGICVVDSLGHSELQSSIRENISVPEGMSDIFTALHAAARPVITSVNVSNGELAAEGLLFTRLIYKSSAGRLYSFSEDVPFNVRMSAPRDAMDAQVCASASAAITGGSGRTAQIAFTINTDAEFYAENRISAVAGLAECDAGEAPSGIMIYIPNDGEDIFDVAKRFRIASSQVLLLNPELQNSDLKDKRVLLFV